MSNEIIIYNMRPADDLAVNLANDLSGRLGELEHRDFPDGESYIRLGNELNDKSVIFVGDLVNPNCKILPLLLAADTARQLGAASIGLVAPYLPYMRQDKTFKSGEAKSAKIFAKIMNREFDWMLTIDPHLHRFHSLEQIYDLKAITLSASQLLQAWITSNVKQPLLIGPDVESEQWVKAVSGNKKTPFRIGTKTRAGDHEVSISLPDLKGFRDYQPIILDDIISTGHTLIETAEALEKQGLKPPICLAVHGLLQPDNVAAIMSAGIEKIVTSSTVKHPTNEIAVDGLIAIAIAAFLA